MLFRSRHLATVALPEIASLCGVVAVSVPWIGPIVLPSLFSVRQDSSEKVVSASKYLLKSLLGERVEGSEET